MFWLKTGILIIGSIYAVLLPYAIYKAVIRLRLNIREYTLSFVSNKDLYGKKTAYNYTAIILLIALLHYIFFWLLSQYYFAGSEGKLLTYLDYSVAGLTLLALFRHNIVPYSLKTLRECVLRFGHNLWAVVVFVSLPALIIVFQSLIVESHKFLGIGGFIIIGLTILAFIVSVIYERKINGVNEIIFISGISVWSIFVMLVTIFC